MSDISICFNKSDFEYDVYTLVKAFYPKADIFTFYSGGNEHPAESFLKLDVGIYDEKIILAGKSASYVFNEDRNIGVEVVRHERKNLLKRLVYKNLSKITGRELPWGTLTGIRPVKIAMRFLDEGKEDAEIAAHMRETYYTSDKKIALATAVANREKETLENLDLSNGYSLYIGIPFCPSICLYCSFGSHPYSKWGYIEEDYFKALFTELKYIANAMAGKSLSTVYIGGGTPTTVSKERLEELLAGVSEIFDLSLVKEFTVEAGRPDTIDSEKLEIMRKYSVDRISINPQSMNQETLDVIGRKHTVGQVVFAFDKARQAGFKNINMDLIVGLPKEGEDQISRSMRAIEELKPDSLTIHSLALKRATRLNLFKEQYIPISFANSQRIMDIIDEGAKRMKMEPYYLYRQKNIAGNMENIGYARRGCYGLYNIIMMEERQTVMAAGSGAISKFIFDDGRIQRAENSKDLKNYTERISEMLKRKEKYLECS